MEEEPPISQMTLIKSSVKSVKSVVHLDLLKLPILLNIGVKNG